MEANAVHFQKDVLWPDSFSSPDGPVVIDSDRIDHWIDQFQRMRAAGLSVPVTWGHPNVFASYNERELADSKYNAGFVRRLFREGEKLRAEFEVPLEDDASRVGTVVREVSPTIHQNFKDGKERTWKDAITQLGLVTQAVVPGQDNFEPVEIANEPVPAMAMRLALSQRLALHMPDDETKVPETETETPETETETEVDAPANKKAEQIARIGAMLEGLGISLGGEVTTLDEFEQSLSAAVETKRMADEKNAGATGLQVEEQPAVAAMSLMMRSENKALVRFAGDTLKSGLKLRIAAAFRSGRLSPVIRDVLNNDTGAIRLSLGSDGGFAKSDAEKRLEVYESLPEGTYWSNEEIVQKMSLDPEEPSADFISGVQLNEEDSKRLAEEMASGKI